MADQVPLILTAGQLSMLPSADMLNAQAGLALKKLASSPGAAPSGFVRLYFKSDGKCYKKDDAGTETEVLLQGLTGNNGSNGTNGTNGVDALEPSTTKTTADVSASSTTLVNVTDASFSQTSGNVYTWEFWVLIQSASATAGVQLAVNGPTSSFITYGIFTPTSATAYTQSASTAWDTKNTAGAVGSTNTTYLAIVRGSNKPTANGTLQLRLASENTNTVKVMTGTAGFQYDMGA